METQKLLVECKGTGWAGDSEDNVGIRMNWLRHFSFVFPPYLSEYRMSWHGYPTWAQGSHLSNWVSCTSELRNIYKSNYEGYYGSETLFTKINGSLVMVGHFSDWRVVWCGHAVHILLTLENWQLSGMVFCNIKNEVSLLCMVLLRSIFLQFLFAEKDYEYFNFVIILFCMRQSCWMNWACRADNSETFSHRATYCLFHFKSIKPGDTLLCKAHDWSGSCENRKRKFENLKNL